MEKKNLIYVFLAVFVLLCVYFVFAAPPTVTLLSPGNATWNNSNTIQFSFQCGSNATYRNIDWNATLWINDVVNASWGNTTGIFRNDTTVNITIALHEDITALNWKIECWNKTTAVGASTGVLKLNSSEFTLGIDTVNPTGGIEMPKTTNVFSQRPIKFYCGGQDDRSLVDKVEITHIKPSKKETQYDLGSHQELLLRGIETGEAGTHVVRCRVYDLAGNTVWTANSEFRVYHRSVKSAAPEEEPEEEVTPGEEAEGVPTEGVPTEKAPSKAWIWILVIVVIILILYFVLKKKK